MLKDSGKGKPEGLPKKKKGLDPNLIESAGAPTLLNEFVEDLEKQGHDAKDLKTLNESGEKK